MEDEGFDPDAYGFDPENGNSFNQTLQSLVDKGFIAFVEDPETGEKYYMTTPEGEKALNND